MSANEKKQKYKNFGYCNEVLDFGICFPFVVVFQQGMFVPVVFQLMTTKTTYNSESEGYNLNRWSGDTVLAVSHWGMLNRMAFSSSLISLPTESVGKP